MRTLEEIVRLLTNPGVIAVVRARSEEQVLPLAEALVEGGVIAIEITLTTPNALHAIEKAAARFGQRALIGVGTVLNAEVCRAAISTGAEFVVSPITKPEIADASHESSKPVMLGAYTPTEAQAAYEAGADFIKLFPADGLGPAYVKALRAPLPHLRIVPTGGVDLSTAAAFIEAGCVALGAGSSLLKPKILEENNWPELTRLAEAFVEVVRKARGK